MLTTAGVEGEAVVGEHLQYEIHEMAVGYHLEEFEVEFAEPNGVVSGREIEEYNACLIAHLKRVLDVIGEESDLIHRRLPVAETRLLIRQLWIDYWVDACMEEAFHELVRDAEKRYGEVPFRIIQRFV